MKKVTAVIAIISILIIIGCGYYIYNLIKAKEVPAATEVTYVNFINGKTSTGKIMSAENNKGKKVLPVPSYPESGNAADLFNSAFPAVKEIIDAEQKYHDKNKKYASDFGELDLSFNDAETHYINNTSRIYLKTDYYFVLTENLIAVYYDNPDENLEEYYHIDFGFDGKATCVSKVRDADKMCVALGGSNPVPNERIPSWMMYTLPDGFLKNTK